MAEFKLNGRFLTDVENRSRKALTAAGQAYLGQMAQTLSNTPARSGRSYQFYKGHLSPIPKSGKVHGRVHVASAPGEPPALLTGDLRRRRGSRLGEDRGDLVMEFGSSVPYARRLEEGDDDHAAYYGVIEARPAWRPTMEQSFKPLLMPTYAETFRRG